MRLVSSLSAASTCFMARLDQKAEPCVLFSPATRALAGLAQRSAPSVGDQGQRGPCACAAGPWPEPNHPPLVPRPSLVPPTPSPTPTPATPAAHTHTHGERERPPLLPSPGAVICLPCPALPYPSASFSVASPAHSSQRPFHARPNRRHTCMHPPPSRLSLTHARRSLPRPLVHTHTHTRSSSSSRWSSRCPSAW